MHILLGGFYCVNSIMWWPSSAFHYKKSISSCRFHHVGFIVRILLYGFSCTYSIVQVSSCGFYYTYFIVCYCNFIVTRLITWLRHVTIHMTTHMIYSHDLDTWSTKVNLTYKSQPDIKPSSIPISTSPLSLYHDYILIFSSPQHASSASLASPQHVSSTSLGI